jgi:myo-inositol 2-dehydrogenase/D-chiro-inositol 1-dehydrogenase
VTDRDLRVGVIGVGLMGTDHADRLAHRTSGARLVAVSDADTARAGALAGRFDGVRAIGDPLALVADDEVDAVLIASPGFVHEEQVLACLEAGKAVLCEKPLTMDGESSLRVVRAERERGRALVQLGFMRRFDPEYARLKGLLDSGRLGRLLVLHNIHRNKDVPDSFRSEMIVRDSLVHEVDVTRFLFGEEIAEVTVYSPTPTSAAAEGVVDPQVSVFRMASGAVVTNEVFVRNQVGYEVRCEAVCERGTAIAGRPWGDLYTTAAPGSGDDGVWGGPVPADFRDRFALAYDLELQAWVDAARRGEVVGPTAWDGYAATVVCEAGMASLASGMPVAVDIVDEDTLKAPA